MSLKMRSSSKYQDIEDIDDLEDIEEVEDKDDDRGYHSESFLKSPSKSHVSDIDEDDLPTKRKSGRKSLKGKGRSIPVKISNGQRVINIRELDPDIIPPTLAGFMDPEHSGSKIAIIGKPGCFAIGTRVRMADWNVKKVEDVKVGEKVMGDDLTPRNVLELCRGKDVMYKIEYPHGNVVVNSKHILVLKHKNGTVIDIPLNEYLLLPDKDMYMWYTFKHAPLKYVSYPFTTTELVRDQYYGFTLDGNHRFLLEDFSVVHNTGKSTLIKSLLYEKSEIFPCAQVYSGTEDSNHSYSKFMPSCFIHNKFDQEAYMNFIKRQKLARKFLSNPWATVIWDDITEDEKIFNLPLVKATYKNGRHWKMLHILSLQYSLDIKPVIRTNLDGTFILRETIQRNRKCLFENYASSIDDYSDFCAILDAVTNDYTALYIHNRVQSNNFEDCVFWYKSRQDIPQDFKFGSKEYWMFHEERYDDSYVDPVEV